MHSNPDYFLNHYDTSRVAETPTDLGITGYPLVIDTSVRLSRLPVVSIGKIYRPSSAAKTRSGSR